jgi:nucleoredoxin
VVLRYRHNLPMRSLILTLALVGAMTSIALAEEPTDIAGLLKGKLVIPTDAGFSDYAPEKAKPADFFVLYFSAHWCPTCKKTTPRLVEMFEKERERHQNFEFVFISSDRSEDEMLQYMRGYRMPWPALKFGEKENAAILLKHAGRGIPCVVVLDREGNEVASSFEAGKYLGPFKPLETLAKLLDEKKAQGTLVGLRD